MKKILVTGGLGYIGSHTVVELQQAGFKVIIIDNLSNSKLKTLERIATITSILPEFEKIDLRNSSLVHDFFSRHKIDGCIHFAALKSVCESQQIPLDYYDNNLNSLINLLQEFVKRDLNNFIFSSSCVVYGQADRMPITEQMPIKVAVNAYGRSKQTCEGILIDYSKAHQKKAILLRYFNPIGAHPSGLIGEIPIGTPKNLIPFMTQTAAGIHKEVLVFGNDYDTPDGTCIRDFIYVVDLAKAHVAALNHQLNCNDKEPLLQIYNLGTGKGSSILETIKTFEKVNRLKLNYKFAPKRQGDIVVAYADATLAEKKLNWSAKTSLAEALRTSWEWQKKTTLIC